MVMITLWITGWFVGWWTVAGIPPQNGLILGRILDPYLDHSSYLWDQGVSVGSILGVHLAIMTPEHTIPIRARAYNDCVKDAVLLKTASK